MLENLVRLAGIIIRFPLFIFGFIFWALMYPVMWIFIVYVSILMIIWYYVKCIPMFIASAWHSDSSLLKKHLEEKDIYSLHLADIFHVDEFKAIYKWWLYWLFRIMWGTGRQLIIGQSTNCCAYEMTNDTTYF